MGDIKNVRVDNWGTFFLQRLHQFFNKTDFCDLTLQFHDNTQLKVHRLVLNACTEYFTVLEQNCEMVEDCLIMPMDLQADVVVPIVNFMYTGQLEFKYSLYERLHSTAQIMNMTVLTKLLDAQNISPTPAKPVLLNRRSPVVPVTYNLQGRKIVQKYQNDAPSIERKPYTWKSHSGSREMPFQHDMSMDQFTVPKPVTLVSTRSMYQRPVDNTPRPTRYEGIGDDQEDMFETSFNNISYESKPLSMNSAIKQEPGMGHHEGRPSTSTFEDLRRNYTVKRPSAAPASPQPDPKRVNLQEVKEYVDAHRVRTNYELDEHGEDAEMESDLYDNQNEEDEDYDEEAEQELVLKQTPAPQPMTQTKPVFKSALKQTMSRPGESIRTVMNVKTAESGANVNHAKIISEVLKKYPHLVKNNKNIKLKVLASKPAMPSPGKPQSEKKIVIGLPPDMVTNPNPYSKPTKDIRQTVVTKRIDAKTMNALIAKGAENTTGPWLCIPCGSPHRPQNFATYVQYRKHLVEVHFEKIDMRICELCGHKSTKRNYLYFHLYTKHNVQPPPSVNFPKCNQCNYVALSDALLVKHKLNHSRLTDFVCNHCTAFFSTKAALLNHIQLTGHKLTASKKDSQQCVYCSKLFLREANMYTHIRTVHKEQARQDGIIEFSDSEEQFPMDEPTEDEMQEEKYIPNNPHLEQQECKIKILSNIPLPSTGVKGLSYMMNPAAQAISKIGGKAATNQKLMSDKTESTKAQGSSNEGNVENNMVQNLVPSSEAEALSNVASGIATSLGLVDSIVVMEEESHYEELPEMQENPEYIVSDLQTIDELSNGNIISVNNTSELVCQTTGMLQPQPEISTTKIITQGNDLKLTEAQQNEIISELQSSNRLTSGNNVVMVLTEEQYKNVKEHELNQDENIYVVYSQAPSVEVSDNRQYLQIGESDEIIEERLDTSEDNETHDDAQQFVQTDNEETWPTETVDMISQDLDNQTTTDIPETKETQDEEDIPVVDVEHTSEVLKSAEESDNNDDKSDEALPENQTELTVDSGPESIENIAEEAGAILVDSNEDQVKEFDTSNIEETETSNGAEEDCLILEERDALNVEETLPQSVDFSEKSERIVNLTEDWSDEETENKENKKSEVINEDVQEHTVDTTEESIENIERELKKSTEAHSNAKYNEETSVSENEEVSNSKLVTNSLPAPRAYSRSQSSEKTNNTAVRTEAKTNDASDTKITKLLDDWDDDSQQDTSVAMETDEATASSNEVTKQIDWGEEESHSMEI